MTSIWSYTQVGINTNTPQAALHVNGNLQITNELNVGGDATTVGNAGLSGQILKSNGADLPPTWENTLDIPDKDGTLISIDGVFNIAQEITAEMSDDFSSPPSIIPIGNLTHVIIDNENKYTATTSSNTFQVIEDGVYKVILNLQVSTTNGDNLVIGIWDSLEGKWAARTNDNFNAPTGSLQTYTIITSIQMFAGRDYSFSAGNTINNFTIKKGGTGITPLSMGSIKRLR